MFSRTCQYALQSILYMAWRHDSGKMVSLKEISEFQKIPIHFLGKILQTLVKSKILGSQKGPNGGFYLNILPEEFSLFNIVEIIDGVEIFSRCGIGMKACSDSCPCPIHNDYKILRNNIKDLFTNKTLADLCNDVENGDSYFFLKPLI